jgi:dipeptidyl aminopeptidase/acylaminoacyl peptidase
MILMFAQAAFAALPPLIPRNVLFGNPDKASPRLSPDGKKLAYLAPEKDVLNVWVRTIGQQDDQVVTADKKRGIRIFSWQQDSEHILYLQDQDGDENWHVYQTNLKTKNTRNLTPFQGVRAEVIAVDPNFPQEMLVGLNLEDRKLHDVYRLNLKNGALELDTKNPGDVSGWTADNALQVRVASVFTPDGGTELRLRDNAKSEWRSFQKWSADETFGGVAAFTPNNQGAWVISSVEANAARLVEFDLASGKSRVISEDPTYDLEGVMTHPTKRTLEAVSYVRARAEWQVLDPALQPDFQVLAKVRDGDYLVVSRDLADKTWIVAYTVDDGPVYYYAYDRGSRRADLLFSNRAALEKFQLAKMRPIQFTARDSLTIHGYLTLPVGLPPKNLPMVLNVHGGPWGRDTWGLNTEVQWLANRGCAVLQVNFRGSTGYGKKFLNAGDREWAGTMHDDLIDAKRWAVQQGYADPNKVCIYGGSYGGYATLVGVTFTPDEFSCGVDIVGPSSLVTLIKSIPPYWVPIKSMFDKRVGKLETEEEFLNSRSPLFKADRIKVPLLIGQGANDPRVKQAESDQIVAAMRKNNKPVEYLVFPDEGHGFARPENRLKFYAATEQFLAKYLGGRAEPPSDKEQWGELKK